MPQPKRNEREKIIVKDEAPAEIHENFNLCKSHVHMDLTNHVNVLIRCGNRSWGGNRANLREHSSVFAAMLGSFKEAHTGVICLFEDDPEAVHVVLKHLHRKLRPVKLPDFLCEQSTGLDPPMMNKKREAWWRKYLEIFKTADKYAVERLRDNALSNLRPLLHQEICGFWSGWEYLVQEIYDTEQTGEGITALKADAFIMASEFKKRLQNGDDQLPQSIQLQMPENVYGKVVEKLIEHYETAVKDTRDRYRYCRDNLLAAQRKIATLMEGISKVIDDTNTLFTPAVDDTEFEFNLNDGVNII